MRRAFRGADAALSQAVLEEISQLRRDGATALARLDGLERDLPLLDAELFAPQDLARVGVNRGQPPVIAEAGSDFARAIREVAKSLLTPDAPKKRRVFAALARA